MVRRIVGGIITVVIGGTTYAVSQSSIANNFSKNTGMSQQQAQTYVKNQQNNLESFSKIGQQLVSDGNTVLGDAAQIDCVNYTYTWVTPSLSCSDGQTGLQTIGNDEVQLGDCYNSLGTDLGGTARSEINDCINDIDTVDADYDLPVATQEIGGSQITDLKNTNLYNKSVLQAALQSGN